MRRRYAATIGALVASLPALAAASPVDLFGYGARGIGTSSAVAASAEGHAAVYYNPAALAFDEQLTFAVGFQRAALSLEVNGEPWKALDAPALDIGFGIPIPFGGALEDRITLGLAFILPQTSILIADTKRPGELTWTLVENRAQTVSIQAALGVRITDFLSVGWGVLALAELEGAIDVAPNATGRLGSQARDELYARYSQVASIHARPLPDWELAAIWRQKSEAEYRLPITVDLGDEFPLPVPTLQIEGVAQFDPQQVTLASSVTPLDALRIDVSLTWKDWSAYRNPIEYTAVPEGYPTQPDPGFADTWVPRLGVESDLPGIEALDVLVRGGFAYEPSPVPEQTGLHNYLDSDRAIPSLGAGLRWRWLTFDVGTQLHLASQRRHEKSCVDDGNGNSIVPLEEGAETSPSYPGGNPGCPSVSHGGRIFVVSTELGVRF
jgi:long-subunit fatty acid transport protein